MFTESAAARTDIRELPPELSQRPSEALRTYGPVIAQQCGICPAECVLRPLIAWLGSNLSFGFGSEVRDGRSNGSEFREGAVLA